MNQRFDMDWEQGKCILDDAAEPTWRVTVAADWAPRDQHAELMLANPCSVYGDLLPLFQASDLNIVNVECALGTVGAPIFKAGPNIDGDPRAVAALAQVPFHVACLANNHSMDFGPERLAETLDILSAAGIKTVGAGMSYEEAAKPLVFQVNGVPLGIVNCGEGEECRSVHGGPGVLPLQAGVTEDLVRALRREVDLVLVVYHGGREHTPLPPPYVVSALRGLAEAGATAIVAHHPHVPQGLEIHQGVPIFYSQGNFVFWQDNPLYYRHVGYLVHLDFAGSQLAGFSLTPYTVTRRGVRAMPASARQEFWAELKEISDLLGDEQAVQSAWDAFVDHVGLANMCKMLCEYGNRAVAGDKHAAASFRNLFATQAHWELYVNATTRVTQGTYGKSPDWARRLVQKWLTRRIA